MVSVKNQNSKRTSKQIHKNYYIFDNLQKYIYARKFWFLTSNVIRENKKL